MCRCGIYSFLTTGVGQYGFYPTVPPKKLLRTTHFSCSLWQRHGQLCGLRVANDDVDLVISGERDAYFTQIHLVKK